MHLSRKDNDGSFLKTLNIIMPLNEPLSSDPH